MQSTQLDHDHWDAVTEALARARASEQTAPPVTRTGTRRPVSGGADAPAR